MPADFVANDFEVVARAMKQIAAPLVVVLHFWEMIARQTSVHGSVGAAVGEAYERFTHNPVAWAASP